jgi:DNA repair protein RadA/Sms
MARPTTVHVCSSCAHETPRWAGRCPGCGEWNTLVEETRTTSTRGGRGGGGVGATRGGGAAVAPVRLGSVEATEVARLPTGIGELDRVLGGGIVPGSLVLIGGSPGIGKSTLTTMALANLTGAGRRTLYVSAEESAAQIKLRAERLSGAALEIPVIAETDLGAVLATLERERPDVCVIDSVQTLHAAELTGAPGSVGQVREVAGEVMRVAKQHRIAVLLVGHVTKEGALAGPRVLEHLVDCVLQFEGERERTYRTLRALKNRFGSTSEAGVFEMRGDGLVEVLDASARFVGEATHAPGSVVLCAMEGSRPLLVEVQALVSPSELVPPRRVVSGIDRNRLALVLAVLTRHGGVALGSADVFVNVVGGVRVDEPGVDLAVALAVASAARGVALRGGSGKGGAAGGRTAGGAPDELFAAAAGGESAADGPAPGPPLACFGELGLTGELRTVAHPERRVAEAAKFGLTTVVGPEARTLRAALRAALPGRARPQAA